MPTTPPKPLKSRNFGQSKPTATFQKPAKLPIRPPTEPAPRSRTLILPRTDAGVAVILASGDVVLQIRADETSEPAEFRVESEMLKSKSEYFNQLLGSSDFAEGLTTMQTLDGLKEKYGSVADIPTDELPRVTIVDVGPVSSAVKSIGPLMLDFLIILHDAEPRKKVGISSLANLVIVADRFDAVETIKRWATATGYFRLRPQGTAQMSEEAIRQRLLIGHYLDNEDWVLSCSTQLILNGSMMWRDDGKQAADSALWWDLPRGVENELIARRSFVLATIGDLQQSILQNWISKNRQCRLGYDTSPQCDSFQLGEFVKFLAKMDTLCFGFPLEGWSANEPQFGDIRSLVTSLKSCPSYQLDANHSHCGPRKAFVAGLEIIEANLNEQVLGLCLDCCKKLPPNKWAWELMPKLPSMIPSRMGDPGVLPWNRGTAGQVETHVHSRARGLFLANERLWNINAMQG